MVVNFKALQASGLSDQDKNPLGGWYIRNNSNKISGLQQNAQAPVWIAIGNSESSNMVKGLQAFTQKQLSKGITSLQYMGTGFTSEIARQIFRKANLQQRVRMIAWPRSTPRVGSYLTGMGVTSN
jgi:predicted amidohydrolase YtcJ